MNIFTLFIPRRLSRKHQQTDDDAAFNQSINQLINQSNSSTNMIIITSQTSAETSAAQLLKSHIREKKTKLIAEYLKE